MRTREAGAVVVLLWTIGCGGGTAPTSPTPPTSNVVTSVRVDGAALLTVGQTAQLRATAIFSDGATEDCTASALWESSNPAVASVTVSGLVAGIAEGEAEIRATFHAVRGAAVVRVARVPPPAGRPLEIHYLDVGQGDAALLIAPNGETVMFDDGPGNCGALVAYLRQQGISRIDYHIASHYHADHIGCAQPVFAALPLTVGLDRGGSYASATFSTYLTAVGPARQTAMPGSTITLDAASGVPVTVQIVAMDSGLSDENDRSVVAVVRYAGFDAEFGGDLTEYAEPGVAPLVGRVEAYKVHHHGSRDGSSVGWLAATSPRVGIVSVGNGNGYGHPTRDCLDRLHQAGVKTYWTEAGAGVTPQAGWDVVAGTTVIEMRAGSGSFIVRWPGGADTYPLW